MLIEGKVVETKVIETPKAGAVEQPKQDNN